MKSYKPLVNGIVLYVPKESFKLYKSPLSHLYANIILREFFYGYTFVVCYFIFISLPAVICTG
jgi:hypothetical protein